jgi:serine/threonine protein kinase
MRAIVPTAIHIEFIHSHDLVHCDIKPTNSGQALHLVNVIDFGLAKKFRDHDDTHIPYK